MSGTAFYAIICFEFQNPGDYYVLHYVARILELVVPLMEHPSENFLMQVEEDMIKLILNHGMLVCTEKLTVLCCFSPLFLDSLCFLRTCSIIS